MMFFLKFDSLAQRTLLLLTICSSLIGVACAQAPQATESSIRWLMLDNASGVVLSKNREKVVTNPKELVAVMTLFTALDLAEKKAILLDTPVSISPQDAARSQSLRRLYLVPGVQTPLKNLLHGIAVTGAEDASYAVASRLAGSSQQFVVHMNELAASLGMRDSLFTSPVADSQQKSTAYDLALLARAFLSRFPQAALWFAEKEFRFSEHSQRNRNLLLWKNDEITGMMSNETGEDLIGTWRRPTNSKSLPRDISVVILESSGGDETANQALNLLRLGRTEFETVRLFSAHNTIVKLNVLKGNRERLDVGSKSDLWVTLNRKTLMQRGPGGFSTIFEYESPLIAPIKEGDKIGTLRVEFESRAVASFDLYALHDVMEGSFFSRFVDSVRLRLNPPEVKNIKPIR